MEPGAVESGEMDLEKLLAGLTPQLQAGSFVFCSFPGARYGDLAHLQPVAMVRESEGLTLVLEAGVAQAQALPSTVRFRCITLGVHSSLSAVGLSAAVSQELAGQGISTNFIAGCFHDHVYVPEARAGEALELLAAMAAGVALRASRVVLD